MPDSIANEEWFGIVAIDRVPRLAYAYYQQDFAQLIVPTDLDEDGLPDEWEYCLVSASPSDSLWDIQSVRPEDDFDGDGASNQQEFGAATDPVDPTSCLRLNSLVRTKGIAALEWQGGTQATQVLESADNLSPTAWTPLLTNRPPTPVTNHFEDHATPTPSLQFYRVRATR